MLADDTALERIFMPKSQFYVFWELVCRILRRISVESNRRIGTFHRGSPTERTVFKKTR